MEYSEEMLVEYLIRHMMRSVSERYSLLFESGLSIGTLSSLTLEGSPKQVVSKLINYLKQFSFGEKMLPKMFDFLIKEPLPKGIPEP